MAVIDDTRTDEDLMEQACSPRPDTSGSGAGQNQAVAPARTDTQSGGFEEIVRRYENRLSAAVYRQLRNEDIAEDIVQETFATAWKDRSNFNKNIAKFSTWIYIILQQQIDKYLRNSRKAREMVSLSVIEEDKDTLVMASSLSGKGSPENSQNEARLNRLKEIILKALDDNERALYRMKEVEGLSYAEIAKREPFVGMKPDALMKRRQRYKDKLIKILEWEKILH